MTLQTVFEFTLPKGFVDEQGQVHRRGTMRLATAMDEIAPLRDPRVRQNEAYLALVVLSQVITGLGGYRQITPGMLERFFAVDVVFLQEFYRYINGLDNLDRLLVSCPNCQHEFETEIPPPGEL